MNRLFSIPENLKTILLKTARESINYYLENNKHKKFTSDISELNENRAVFVTLTINQQLRGCIGTTMPFSSLIDSVAKLAISAAVEDPRFPMLSLEELSRVKIEISVLSPLQKIESHEDIIENVHGVMVRAGGRSGLFLPQVWEHFSSKEDFMNELCFQKAGIAPDSWKYSDLCELFIFEVFSFEED